MLQNFFGSLIVQHWPGFALSECFLVKINKFCSVYSVSQKVPPEVISHFPKRLGIFSPSFKCLHIPIYARLQIFIHLSPTAVTKLCDAILSATTQRAFWPMVMVNLSSIRV